VPAAAKNWQAQKNARNALLFAINLYLGICAPVLFIVCFGDIRRAGCSNSTEINEIKMQQQ